MLHTQKATSEVERAKKARVMQRMNFRLRNRFKKRRGSIAIIVDILSVAGEKAKKTQIVYKANLNFRMVGEYLPHLVDKGLIENTDGEYKTTEKGEEFLTDYQKMKEILK
ncbi:MAG: winged helix-turn-helix domain-containing protein [Methanophagales archaeon]|nr:winged helix-turn-helix domain-containing protein [Methanophagales archaeon]